VDPGELIQAGAEAIPEDDDKMLPGYPCPRKELGRHQCAYCHKEGPWNNDCPQWARDSQKTPQTRGRGPVVKGKYQTTYRGASPWEENNVSLAGLEGYEEEED
jgi:hypothetical protein